MKQLKAGVLGATGPVGQKFIRLLDDHPQFKVTELYASERKAGKTYAEAAHWIEEAQIPTKVAGMTLRSDTFDLDADVLFSAIPAGTAGPIELEFARRGFPVFSNARDLRRQPDMPLVIPEVNPDHLQLIERQRKTRKTEGFVVTNGNCTSIVMTMAVKPLLDAYGLKHVSVVSMQALSGAGYPGVASLDILDNVVPYIAGEEEKLEWEPKKILGTLKDAAVEPAEFDISATCTRVPVLEGHTEAISVKLGKKATIEEVAETMRLFRGRPQELKLPTAPATPIVVRNEPDRPQPRIDRSEGNHMSVVVGRIRPDPVYDVKLFALGSNTVRGAAGGSVLNAELASALGYF